jgi:arsenical pump membrane protein
MFISVILIVSNRRLKIEKQLRRKYNIDRVWWIPPLAILVNLAFGPVKIYNIETSFKEDLHIIILVLCLSMVAEGMRKSSFFRFLASKIVDLCKGNTYRLVIYMFILISIITVFTTNDIIVLVFTPIIIEICYQAKIKNTNPLLLSQFIAANTFSMGSLIGSPTNIIIAEEFSINFISYYKYMMIPTIVSFISTIILLYSLLRFDFIKIKKSYSTIDLDENLNIDMIIWLGIFIILVILTIIITFLNISLYWCSIPTIILSLIYWYLQYDNLRILTRLPYGIFFFGMAFFIFSEAFSQVIIFEQLVKIINKNLEDSILVIPYSIIGSSLLVNIFNDLPASTIIAEILTNLEIKSDLLRFVMIQSMLVGLNIGKYLTQVGALAGIIWFSSIYKSHKYNKKKYKNFSDKIKYPNRKDLVKFGIINFIFTGFLIVIALIIQYLILKIFV